MTLSERLKETAVEMEGSASYAATYELREFYRLRAADLLAAADLIDRLDSLRADEDASVTIHCPNTGREGPVEAIDVYRDWGGMDGWYERPFTGESLSECFQRAAEAAEATKEEA
jgi:hypothetical protein